MCLAGVRDGRAICVNLPFELKDLLVTVPCHLANGYIVEKSARARLNQPADHSQHGVPDAKPKVAAEGNDRGRNQSQAPRMSDDFSHAASDFLTQPIQFVGRLTRTHLREIANALKD